MQAASARREERPADAPWRREDVRTVAATSPAPDLTVRTQERSSGPGPRRRRLRLPIATALALFALGGGSLALMTYRIQTETGELVIESEDPTVEVIVKQGGKQVTIVDPQTKNRIELNSGKYELELPGDKPGLRLSTEKLTLKRGEKTIVTVRREAPKPGSTSELLAGAEADDVGEIARFQSPHDVTAEALFLPDGRRLVYVTGGDFIPNKEWLPGTDPALWLGDLADSKNPRKFTGHASGGIQFALRRDGRVALTASADKTLRLWDLETGKSRRVRREEAAIGHVAFAPDERHAAYVCGDTIRLCDLKTGDELTTFRGHTGRIWGLAFCGEGRRLVSVGVDNTIRVWNVKTGEEIRRMKHGSGVVSVAMFPDGRRAMTGSWDETIGVWDLDTGQQLRRIAGIANRFGANVSVSPDGHRALFGVHKTVWLWDLETGEPLERLEGHTDGVLHVAFAADGRYALSASYDKTVRVWALPPGRPAGEEPPVVEVAHFLGHAGAVDSAVVSPDGRRILSGSYDKTMILWDRETRQPIRRFNEHGGKGQSVAFAPDGRRALSGGGDGVLRLWDLESGDLIHEFHGHTQPVLCVAISLDGKLAYSAGDPDGTQSAVRVWDVETGQEVRKLEGHNGTVCARTSRPTATTSSPRVLI